MGRDGEEGVDGVDWSQSVVGTGAVRGSWGGLGSRWRRLESERVRDGSCEEGVGAGWGVAVGRVVVLRRRRGATQIDLPTWWGGAH